MTDDRDCLFQNYVRAPVAFTHGRGARLYDAAGREYLDFIGGIATSCLGHAHPRLVGAIAEQAGRYIHVSNLFRIPEQERAARLLVEASKAPSSGVNAARGLDRVFFCNSGTEANEAAIKIARKRGSATGRHQIIVTHKSFHGRTLGSLAATGNPRYHQGFGPLPAGFVFVDWNDLGAARAAVTDQTCAVLVEPVLGESGVFPADPEYLRGLEALCREHDLLFLLDEVQTGVGRTALTRRPFSSARAETGPASTASSAATSRPSPRTSVTPSTPASPARSRSPIARAFSTRPSSRMVSSTAATAAVAIALPPKVEP